MRRAILTGFVILLLFPAAMATGAVDHRAVLEKAREHQGYLPTNEAAFEKFCEAGDGYACLLYARQSGVKAAFPARRFRELQEECQARNSVSCLGSGQAFEWGVGARRSIEDARHYYGVACALREADACFSLARLRGEADSADLLKQACTWGSSDACVETVARSKDASRELQLEKLCAEGRAHACHVRGQGAEGAWLSQACERGDADACHELGRGASGEQALSYFKKACDGGAWQACQSSRSLLENLKTFWPRLARHLTLVFLAVGAFAAWMAHLKAGFEALSPESQLAGRAAELRRLRTAGLIGLGLQFVVLVAADLAAPAQRFWNGAFFTLAVMLQAQFQFNCERKVRALEASAGQQLGLTVRAIAAFALMIAGYGALVGGSVLVFTLATRFAMQVPRAPEWATGAGALTGALLGLLFVYVVAPVQIRLLFPVTRIRDGALLEKLHLHFARAGLKAPDFWMIEMDHFRMTNAMVAGAPWGKGWLRPGLFITRSLAREFTTQEFEAVVCHEMSHLLLKHLRKRVRLIGAVFFGGYLANLFTLAVLLRTLPQAAHPFAVFGLVAATFAFQYSMVRRNVRVQEIEADAFAVSGLGASASAMASALHKLDLLNDQQSGSKDPTSYLSPSAAHPTTRERVRLLEARFGSLAASTQEAAQSDQAA